MKGTILWVKLPHAFKMDDVEKLKSSFKDALVKNLEPDDNVIFSVGDMELKCFNGNLIELSESERDELVKRFLK